MIASNKQRAIIYCRISDKGQTGLGSQEHRCRQYAEAKEYEVAQVFEDKFTGGGDFMKRTGMVALLRFLDDHPTERFVVIFDDLKRYARDTEFHLRLRREMMDRGAIRECLNFNFEDTPEGKFNETINAAFGELDRETIKRQSRKKTIARLEKGYCVISRPPIGLKYEKAKGGGKVLVHDEPYASVVTEMLEGFATGRFSSKSEAARFLEAHPRFPRHLPKGKSMENKVTLMLTQPLYAGYVGSEKLGVSLRDGQHNGLISKATFQKIKERLEGRINAPARKDLHVDFPLRGAVACSSCGRNLRASWSRGCRQRYAYYICQTKGNGQDIERCSEYGKSIPRGKIEAEFETLLKAIQPSRNLFKAMVGMAQLYWARRASQAAEIAEAINAEIADTEEQICRLVDRIVEARNDRAIRAMEDKIAALEEHKAVLAEKSAISALPQPSFKEAIELSWRFVANPYNIWQKGSFQLRRLVLKLVFLEPLTYDRNEGYRTPPTSIVFSALGGNSGQFLANLGNGGR